MKYLDVVCVCSVWLWGLTNGQLTQNVRSECTSRCDGNKVTVPYSDEYYSAFQTPASTPKTRFCILVHPKTVDRLISQRIQKTGLYGHAILFEQIFLANGKDTFLLDAGANIGFHTLQAAAVGVHVISWEPNPMNFALLKSSIHTNCFEKLIHLENAALGTPTQAGTTMDMRVHVQSPGLSTLANSSILENSNMTFDRNFKVRLVTMDSTLQSICALKKKKRKSIISLLKIDVEGFEEYVLRGASELFDNRVKCFEKPRHVHIEIFPVLLRAAGSTPAVPLEWLVSKGYDLFFGLGAGPGSQRQSVGTSAHKHELHSMGCTHIYGETYAVPVESIGDLIQFLIGESLQHLDVLAQRLSPSLPTDINAWNRTSVFYVDED